MSKPQGFNLRSKPGISSTKESTPFPVFGVCWSSSATAYCGGGGSAKTGVGNAIVINNSSKSSSSSSNNEAPTTLIDTKSEVCVCIDIYPKLLPKTSTEPSIVYVAAAIGTQIQIYQSNTGLCMGVYDLLDKQKQQEQHDDTKTKTEDEKFLLGISVVVFAPNGYGLLVGCEDGTILSLGLHYENVIVANNSAAPPKVVFTEVATLLGHCNAICGLTYLLLDSGVSNNCFTCAKDGTARLWNFQTGELLATANCSIADTTGDQRGGGSTSTMKRKQLQQQTSLVRGCAQGHYGLLYTVQSGRRGKAYVSQWRVVVQDDLKNSAATTGTGSSSVNLVEIGRICISDVPISAMCMTFDKTMLVLGSVDGSVLLLSLHKPNNMSIIRNYKDMHDLPVTAVSPCCRPYNNNHPIDILTASADGKLNFISLDKQPIPRFVLHLWFYVCVILILFGWITWENRCYLHILTATINDISTSLEDFKLCALHSFIDLNRSPFETAILH